MKFGVDFEVPSIGDKMGLGGTASVYVGKLVGDAIRENEGIRKVAIKAMNMEDSTSNENSESLSSFHYEIAIMSCFPPHPNVVRFVGYCDKPRIILMKFYEANLSDMLRRKDVEIPLNMAIRIAYDVANGMNHIHKHGILHLDVKPSKNNKI